MSALRFLSTLFLLAFIFIPALTISAAGEKLTNASELSHPPTFQQMQEASSPDARNSSAIYAALKYTDDDVKLLIANKNHDYIIGAAYQYDKVKSISLLKDHFPLLESRPAGLSLYISRALQEYGKLQNINYEYLTERLIKIDPENGYGYYLKAYYFSKLNNADECLRFVKQANTKRLFNNHLSELSNISISTSLFLGYSKFVAQSYALGLQHDIMIFSGLSKYLTQKTLGPEFKMECQKMGVILRKNSKTLLNDFMAYAVQLRAMKELKDKENEIRIIEQEKKESMDIYEMAHAIDERNDIPEDRWVEYYNDLYSNTETYAILKLSKEFPVKGK